MWLLLFFFLIVNMNHNILKRQILYMAYMPSFDFIFYIHMKFYIFRIRCIVIVVVVVVSVWKLGHYWTPKRVDLSGHCEKSQAHLKFTFISERGRSFDPSIPVSWQESVPMFPSVDKVSNVEDSCVDLDLVSLLLLSLLLLLLVLLFKIWKL